MPRYIPGAACWWPMAPKPPSASAQLCPTHKPPLASAGLSILGRKGKSGGSRPRRAHGCRQAVPPSRPSRWWASALLAEGRQRERSAQVIPGRSRFGPSYWSITAPPACVILPLMPLTSHSISHRPPMSRTPCATMGSILACAERPAVVMRTKGKK